ncbi:pentapeptide repeat-containing protein [Streptomyces sp. NPDC058770]|uniref:pentapeptide repeat-containing protein n=1 Tax=Streptomyces sp. NPDC058770 TaxID=3346631 RepID=UPI0036B70DAA
MRSSRRQPQGRVNAPKDWGSRGLALFIKDGCRRAGGALRRCPGQQIRLRRAASALAVRTGRPVAEGPLREPSTDNAWFSYVAFPGDADFEDANFTGDAGFGNVTFTGNARFSSAAFTGNAWFSDATFTHDADFDHLTFARDAQFSGARFERAPFLVLQSQLQVVASAFVVTAAGPGLAEASPP